MKAVLLLLVLCICANSAKADFGDAFLSFVKMIIPGTGKGRGNGRGRGRWGDNDDYDQPEPLKTQVYVSVMDSSGDRVYRLTSQPVQPSSWRQITRGNAISGDVSYFKGYVSSYRGFDFQINGTSMYVSRSREPGTVRYMLTECYVNGQKSTRVSSSGGCGGNGRVANNYEFYALPGRLACEIPAMNAHTSDRRTISNGLPVLITYTCTVGSRIVGGDRYIVCADGRWMGTPLQCDPIQCGRPTGILNGQVLGDTFTYRSTVSYECNQGYQLSASSSRVKQCNQFGEWIPRKDPECVRVQRYSFSLK